jgi:hypothetical protein
MQLVKLAYQPVFRWAIRRVLVGRSRSPAAADQGRRELRRSRTLAAGDHHCDFRFIARSPAAGTQDRPATR